MELENRNIGISGIPFQFSTPSPPSQKCTSFKEPHPNSVREHIILQRVQREYIITHYTYRKHALKVFIDRISYMFIKSEEQARIGQVRQKVLYPNVSLWSRVLSALKDFRCGVWRTATPGRQLPTRGEVVAEAKI